MDSDEIYRFIGYAVAVLFFIYIISKTIRLNARVIEGYNSFDGNDNGNSNSNSGGGNDSNSGGGGGNSNDNGNDSNSGGGNDGSQSYIKNLKQVIQIIKGTNDNPGTLAEIKYYKKIKQVTKQYYQAIYDSKNIEFHNLIAQVLNSDDWTNTSALVALKQEMELIEFASKSLDALN